MKLLLSLFRINLILWVLVTFCIKDWLGMADEKKIGGFRSKFEIFVKLEKSEVFEERLNDHGYVQYFNNFL